MTVVIDNAKLDRIARSAHAAIALDEGMKAGFRSYMASPGHDRTFDSLNGKRAFDRYCGEFGPYLDLLNDVQEPELDELEQLQAEIRELKAQIKAGASVTTVAAKPKKAKASKFVGRESRFSNAVIERKNLPTEIGDEFVWTGPNGTSTWEVVEDDGEAIYAVRIA